MSTTVDAARLRGWHNLRLLSAGVSTFKYDFRSEDAQGNQDSGAAAGIHRSTTERAELVGRALRLAP